MPLAFALAISALLHAAAITMPGWDLPGEAETPPLEARLAPRPPVAPNEAAKGKPLPRSRPARKPAAAVAAVPKATAEETEPVSPLASSAPEISAAPEPAAAPPAVEPSAPPGPPAPPWPAVGSMHYLVTYGERGFVIGEKIDEWRMEGERYSIRSGFEPKGLAALRGRKRTQASEGDVTAEGLRPREFRDHREGRDAESAVFDWAAARVVFSGGRSNGALAAGTQDLLSVFYQLAWQAPHRTIDVAVATASRVGRWTFEWMGEDSIKIAEADVAALHLRTRSDGDTTEVWLAPAYGGLPIKIRYIDRGGDVYEQIADSLGH